MTSPCSQCPFRKDCPPGWLGKARAIEIADGGEFPCHKTVTRDGDGDRVETDKEQHCAGMLILLEKMERPHQMMRICERIGLYDMRKLNMDAPVFGSRTEFVRHHTKKAKS